MSRKTEEPPVVYDDPLMGRREFKTKWEFTQAAEHEKWCCNCRYCHHAHYWRFDEDDETCQVVMETCQCRKIGRASCRERVSVVV